MEEIPITPTVMIVNPIDLQTAPPPSNTSYPILSYPILPATCKPQNSFTRILATVLWKYTPQLFHPDSTDMIQRHRGLVGTVD